MPETRLSWFPWNGSKKWMLGSLEQVFRRWPAEGRFIDPFCGGGSVSYLAKTLWPKTAQRVSDANPWLMSVFEWQTANEVYRVPRNFLNTSHWRKLKDEDLSKLTLQEQATRFAVCLLTAWGNRWETHSTGEFRSTINGRYCDENYLRRRLEAFFGVKWLSPRDTARSQDWTKALAAVKAGDLVYLDPPYPESLGYGNQWWDFSDQLDVVDWAADATRRGVSVVISNMATIERLYKRAGFETKVLRGPAASKTRRVREEVLAWKIHE